eukprot:2176947-Prymnesium_polylepis.1
MDWLATEGSEDSGRCARNDDKCEAEHQWQDTLRSANHASEDALRSAGPAALDSVTLQQPLPANKSGRKDDDENEGPCRAQHQALAVITQARARHKDALEFRRHFKDVNPPSVLFKAQRGDDVEDARHSS